MRSLIILVSLAVAAVLAGSLHVQAAESFTCSDEHGIFWRMTTSGGGALDRSGAINEITLNSHPPINCVPGEGQTARVWFLVFGNYFEAGWQEYNCGGSSCFRSFVEYSLNSMGQQWISYTNPPCLTPGTKQFWRVEGEGGGPSNLYDAFANCEDGYGLRYLTTWSVYPYSHGWAEGEGYRRADNSPTATHQAMQFRNLSGGWAYAGDVSCRRDTDGSWDGYRITHARFDIASGTQTCNITP
jgi:hypothetical protein